MEISVPSEEEAREALEKSSAVVVDIREPGEQTAGVAKGALLIPMGQLEKRLGDITKSKTQPLILICATQNRSSRLVEQLHAVDHWFQGRPRNATIFNHP